MARIVPYRELYQDRFILLSDGPYSAVPAADLGLDDAEWRRRIDSLRVTNAFAVWRLWLDRPVARGRSGFAGTAGVGPLDNISVYENLEDESRAWAARTGDTTQMKRATITVKVPTKARLWPPIS